MGVISALAVGKERLGFVCYQLPQKLWQLSCFGKLIPVCDCFLTCEMSNLAKSLLKPQCKGERWLKSGPKGETQQVSLATGFPPDTETSPHHTPLQGRGWRLHSSLLPRSCRTRAEPIPDRDPPLSLPSSAHPETQHPGLAANYSREIHSAFLPEDPAQARWFVGPYAQSPLHSWTLLPHTQMQARPEDVIWSSQ